MAVDDFFARCKCGTAMQWDWCHDVYWDPENGCWHTDTADNLHLCWKCGAKICQFNNEGVDEIIIYQPHLKNIDWELAPYKKPFKHTE